MCQAGDKESTKSLRQKCTQVLAEKHEGQWIRAEQARKMGTEVTGVTAPLREGKAMSALNRKVTILTNLFLK